jgi:hypothetical protein
MKKDLLRASHGTQGGNKTTLDSLLHFNRKPLVDETEIRVVC